MVCVTWYMLSQRRSVKLGDTDETVNTSVTVLTLDSHAWLALEDVLLVVLLAMEANRVHVSFLNLCHRRFIYTL